MINFSHGPLGIDQISKPSVVFLLSMFLLILFLFPTRSGTLQTDEEFQNVPTEVRDIVLKTRKLCQGLGAKLPDEQLHGVRFIDLDGDGSKDIVLDAKEICGRRIAEANCSYYGCDLIIWKQTGKTSWERIFNEHVWEYFLSVSSSDRFRLLAVSIPDGNSFCETETDAMSCDAIVLRKNKSWVWEPIR